jgi:hypothetical protein
MKIHLERSLDSKLEDAVPEAGPNAPAGERREKRFRPEVLVDVDCEQAA